MILGRGVKRILLALLVGGESSTVTLDTLDKFKSILFLREMKLHYLIILIAFALNGCVSSSTSNLPAWKDPSKLDIDLSKYPRTTLTVAEAKAWEGKTFAEVKATFGKPTNASTGSWIYTYTRLVNATQKRKFEHRIYSARIHVVDELAEKEFETVMFLPASTPIDSDTKVRNVSWTGAID